MNRTVQSSTACNTPDWVGLGFDGWQLWNDAAAVIWLRGVRIAQGGMPAATEAQQMVAEKLEASTAFLMDVATGAAGSSAHAVTSRAIGVFGKKVRENRRRLMR